MRQSVYADKEMFCAKAQKMYESAKKDKKKKINCVNFFSEIQNRM